MIPSAARAIERLFGPALSPAAGAARLLAWAALAAVVLFLGVRAVGALRRRSPGVATAALVIAAATVVAAVACRIGEAAPPLAAIPAAIGFLFFAGAASAAARAASPAARGRVDRAVSVAAALLLLVPAGVGLALSRGLDPPAPRVIGSLWTTPTALYVAGGVRDTRARREGPPATEVRADVVTAKSLLFGVTWTGIARFSGGGPPFPWRGRGGRLARLLDRFGPSPGGALLSVERTRVDVATPPNVRVWIFRSPAEVRFTSATRTDAPDAPDLTKD
jgi:hypothetical protein